MFIVMHCMGMPFDGDTIKEKSLGGSETAAYYVAKELAKAGHRVTMFTHTNREGVYDDVNYINLGNITDQTPLGDRFHFYAQNTPHDVLIIQRHPHAFRFPFAAKIKLWWVHDLAMVRNKNDVHSMLWNVDGILTVSEYHKKQFCEIYGIDKSIVYAITNGIDLSLFNGDVHTWPGNPDPKNVVGTRQVTVAPADQFKMLYSSRPERGLEHLLATNGIMERLAKDEPDCHLYVCGYDNVTEHMRDYYAYLEQRIEELSNVTKLGALTKQELADVMRQCDLLVYPTPGPKQPEFNEVSCITAMEAMAAGLPFLSCKRGALPETCKESGSILIKPTKKGMPPLDKFVKEIKHLKKDCDKYLDDSDINKGHYRHLVKQQLKAARKYTWTSVAKKIASNITVSLMDKNRTTGAIARHLMGMSDIYALRHLFKSLTSEMIEGNPILKKTLDEMNTHYQFAFGNNWREHYEKYYEYERDRGVEYGPETLDGNPRFEHVSSLVGHLPDGGVVLDYGCAHGGYTINLAKRFPGLNFMGVDIAASNIEKARAWAEKEEIKNVRFIHGSITKYGDLQRLGETDEPKVPLVDVVIAAEVVEHVGDPVHLCDSLAVYLKEKGLMIITTPYGPWEAAGYFEHDPWRAHVHHFEREDLHDLFGMHKNFAIAAAPSGLGKKGSVVGSYITTYQKPTVPSGAVDYDRKISETVPGVQTVSLCMIVKDGEKELRKALDSLQDVADEVIIGLDRETTDRTAEIIGNFSKDRKKLWPNVLVVNIDSPLKTGFDAARNETIKHATGDWIMWVDYDEITVNADNIYKYLRNNQYQGYAVAQHHFTVEPLGVLKTDYPCRLFRNHRRVKFFGIVHEHPETAINKGVGHVCPLQDVHLAHNGYTTENIRRKRFDRNIALLVRDREKYPTRKLGKYLWLRDLAQMCKYELEFNGSQITAEMKARAREGMKLWEELLAANELRMLVDGMEYYGLLARILGGGFDFGFKIDSSKLNGGVNLETAKPITAYFLNEDHVKRLMVAITDERLKDYGSQYF